MSAYGVALSAYEEANVNSLRLDEIEKLLANHGIKSARVKYNERLIQSGAYPHVSISVREEKDT